MTSAELRHSAEVQLILANIADLQPGMSLTLADLAHDGFGGVVVKRSRAHGNPLVFQREFSRERSRWADSLADAMREVEVYVNTGKLHEPDSFGF